MANTDKRIVQNTIFYAGKMTHNCIYTIYTYFLIATSKYIHSCTAGCIKTTGGAARL